MRADLRFTPESNGIKMEYYIFFHLMSVERAPFVLGMIRAFSISDQRKQQRK